MSRSSLNRKLELIRRFFFGWGSTWSQFGEDAHLLSYFRNKGWTKESVWRPMEKGFYVDVGCFHPVRMSNTLAFYKQNWRGINIDATPGSKALFDRWRPRDINLELAISTEKGSLTFYTEGGSSSVFNTTSATQAKEYTDAGFIRNLVEVNVPSLPLSTVLDLHLPKETPISFLSVDAEGNDLLVLKSNDWARYRPELVLAETQASSLADLASEEIVEFMLSKRYDVRSWIAPTLVFSRRD